MTTTTLAASERKPAFLSKEELKANDRVLFDFNTDAEEGDEKTKKQMKKNLKNDQPNVNRADKINLTVLRAAGNGEGWFATCDTWTSIPMMKVYKREIAAARKLVKEKKYQDAFCVALATFLSMNDYDMWFRDTEDIKSVETTFTSYYKVWTEIFKESDETIGLKGRDVLIKELRNFGQSAREVYEYNFKWFE
ncbi:hypothetical protein AC1031_001972 [Aphanomyces cochlioides]|nr:hypothetical protein AC1031_001972 [Aphanomyces cochlioides]